MSIFDVMECRKSQEEHENLDIRIAVDAWRPEKSSETQDMIEGKINQRKDKTKSLLFLVGVINKNHSEAFTALMKYDEDGVIDKYVYDKMVTTGGRYMVSTETAIYNATTEAVTQMILDDEKAQKLLDELLSEIFPQFYSKKKSEQETLHLLVDFIKKQVSKGKKINQSKVCVSFREEVLAFFYYFVTWKLEENKDNELNTMLHEFVGQMDLVQRHLINERRTDTSFDWLAGLFGMTPEELEEDKIFLKYKEACYARASKWLHTVLAMDEFMDVDLSEADAYMETEDYEEYLFCIFKELVLTLQDIESAEDVKADAFGKNPLSAVLNSLAEIKWYPKMIGKENIRIAFNLATLSTTCSYAIISFEEDEIDKLQRTTLIRKSCLKNPESFVCSLFTSFVLNLIAVEYKRKDYDTFTIGRDMEMLMKEQMKKDNTQQTIQRQQEAALCLKDEEIERLKASIRRLSERQQDEDKLLEKKIKPLEDENRSLWKENEKLKEELEALKQKKSELESMIEAYEETIGKQEEIIENNETVTDEELRQQKILFVGGRYELIRTLKNIMENAKFVQTETDPLPDFGKIERIIYFGNFINHSTYNKVFDRAKVLSVPYQFIHTQNYEQVWEILKKKSV